MKQVIYRVSQETIEKGKFFFDFRKLINDKIKVILKWTKPWLIGLVISVVKELSLCHKFNASNPYIFST